MKTPALSYSAISFHRLRLVSLFCAAMAMSCEKVIDIELQDAQKKYVIEATVTDQPGGCRVLVSQTKSFSDSNGFAGVSGAVVTLTDDNASTVTLTPSGPGVYTAPSFAGTEGRTYHLDVTVNGERFTASSRMAPKVLLDSIYITERTGFDGVRRKVVTAQFNDPPGMGDAYRFIKYVNGNEQSRIFVRNDNLTDGRTVKAELRGGLNAGDTIAVDMQVINPIIYKYWFSLDENATGDEDRAAPANPVTNLSGGALGYFSAHTVQRKTLIVP